MRMIVAVDQDNAIGWADGRLPWRSSQDMGHFKSLTTAGDDPAVIMGRKTWDSLPAKFRPLPDRTNYVITADELTALSIEKASGFPLLSWPNVEGKYTIKASCWLIGGASIYNEALTRGRVDELYITLVNVSSGADVKLAHDLYNWKSFVQQESLEGRIWALESISVPLAVVDGEPSVSFIHLIKQPS